MKKFSQLAIPYIVWMVLMLVLPMALIAMYSITQHGNSIISFSLTLEHYKKFFTDSDFLLILGRSLMIAFKTTVICLLIGYPAAYFISRSDQKIQSLLLMAITIPTWINALVRTYAWIGLLSEGTHSRPKTHKTSVLYRVFIIIFFMAYHIYQVAGLSNRAALYSSFIICCFVRSIPWSISGAVNGYLSFISGNRSLV